MLQKRKQGFTIVELVIVIAVVAILAAVLIPTFTTLVGRAKQSNDKALIRNLNTILAASSTVDGKPETMHDALAFVAENGYTVEKLTPTSTGDILWDQTTNRFALVEDGKYVFATGKTSGESVDRAWSLWKIINNGETPSDTYSNYLSDGYVVNDVLTVKTGIDTGTNTGLSISLTTDESASLIIRTNAGGTVAVNTPNANVSHVGSANQLKILAVKSASYHLYGEIKGDVEINAGRFVAEAGAKISAVIVSPTAADGVSVDLSNQATVGTVVAGNEQGQTIINNSTTIPTEIKGTTPLTDEDIANRSKFAGGLGTKDSPYLIANQEQFIRINDIGSTVGVYFKLVDDIVISEHNYLQYGFYKAAVDKFNGVLDGDNHSIKSVSVTKDDYIYGVFANAENCTLKNIRYIDIAAPFVCDMKGEVEFDNVDVYGGFEVGNNTGAYAIYARTIDGYSDFKFKNCNSYADFTGAGSAANYNAVFVGYLLAGTPKNYHTLTFENCTNEGSLVVSTK